MSEMVGPLSSGDISGQKVVRMADFYPKQYAFRESHPLYAKTRVSKKSAERQHLRHPSVAKQGLKFSKLASWIDGLFDSAP